MYTRWGESTVMVTVTKQLSVIEQFSLYGAFLNGAGFKMAQPY